MTRKRTTRETPARTLVQRAPRLRQCWRCRVRLSGELAGYRSGRALPDYEQILCNACRDELAASGQPCQGRDG